jgi:hypothetical protein
VPPPTPLTPPDARWITTAAPPGLTKLITKGNADSPDILIASETWPEPESPAAPYPLIVSFYTRNTPYEAEAARLRASCQALHLPHRIVPVDPTGSWERNCALKASIIHDAWRTADTPVLWVDADATINRPPNLLTHLPNLNADFALFLYDGWRTLSGTLWFNQTDHAAALLDRWQHACTTRPAVWDQLLLDLAWEETTLETTLTTAWLPARYCRIAGLDTDADLTSAIVAHGQASRTLKGEVSEGRVLSKRPDPTESVRRARAQGRPRTAEERAADPLGFVLLDADPTRLHPATKRTLAANAARRCAAEGHTTIALYGAGHHTRALGLEVFTDAGLTIAAILDDHSTGELNDIPITHPRNAPTLPITAIILSSDAHEAALAERARPLNLPIYPIYAAATAD